MTQWLTDLFFKHSDSDTKITGSFNEAAFEANKQEFSCCSSGLSFYHPEKGSR